MGGKRNGTVQNTSQPEAEEEYLVVRTASDEIATQLEALRPLTSWLRGI